MFREVEEKPRHIHPSYTNKPKPEFQLVLESGKFDDTTSTLLSQREKNEFQEPVPTTWDTYYDPNHPNADWTGLVSLKNQEKKHSQKHRSQMTGIEQIENGLVSIEEKKEFPKKKHINVDYSKSFVLGGIDTESSSRYKTTSMSLQNHEGTSRDQLIMEKRVKPKKELQIANIRKQNEIIEESYLIRNDKPPEQMKTRDFTSKSLISDISSSLLHMVPNPPASTDAIVQKGSTNVRTLLVDNYKPFPGYTGHLKK